MHKFDKPDNWNDLPLYKKVKKYGETLTSDYSIYVDKLEMKKIIRKKFGDNLRTAIVIRILDSPNDISYNDINNNHMIKSSHASGWNIDFIEVKNLDKIKFNLNSWNRPYFKQGLKEPQYDSLQPRFFIEQKIKDKQNNKVSGKALVYMVRCIHGNPFSIRVKDSKGKSSSYDLSWNYVDKKELNIPKPVKLKEMIEYSKDLSKPFEFVRVDFYIDAVDNLYFSELTFTPSGGGQNFTDEIELEYGKLWT